MQGTVSRHHLSCTSGCAAVSDRLVRVLMGLRKKGLLPSGLDRHPLGNHHYNNPPRFSPRLLCIKWRAADVLELCVCVCVCVAGGMWVSWQSCSWPLFWSHAVCLFVSVAYCLISRWLVIVISHQLSNELWTLWTTVTIILTYTFPQHYKFSWNFWTLNNDLDVCKRKVTRVVGWWM